MQTESHRREPAYLPQALAEALPAHELLTLPYEETGGAPVQGTAPVWIHVQGRGDRIHAVANASQLTLAEASNLADTLRAVAANWRWLAAESAPIWLPELCKERGLGLLTLQGSGAVRTIAAPPTPGIFLPSYPELRAGWKKLAAW